MWYNWSDYIDRRDQLKSLPVQTRHLKVNYNDDLDSNEMLRCQLKTGSPGYDVVCRRPRRSSCASLPASSTSLSIGPSSRTGANLDPSLMEQLALTILRQRLRHPL